jgi:hypothetical protein
MEVIAREAMWHEEQQKAEEVPDQVQAIDRAKRKLITDIQDQVTLEACVNEQKETCEQKYVDEPLPASL